MRFDNLAILILSAGCMTPFVIAGLLQLIDRIIERGMCVIIRCFDCDKFGTECTDMTGTKPACDSFKPKVFTFSPDMKPQYYESAHIFKSLYPELLASISIKIHCDDPEIDPNIILRIKNAAYREYSEIMRERQNAAHGFNVCGTWDMKGGEENDHDN